MRNKKSLNIYEVSKRYVLAAGFLVTGILILTKIHPGPLEEDQIWMALAIAACVGSALFCVATELFHFTLGRKKIVGETNVISLEAKRPTHPRAA